MVVFLDGVDGSGKTTLLHGLAEVAREEEVTIAPPLWHWLPAVDRPEAFADWVTRTAAERVAVELLEAQRRRIDALRSRASGFDASTVLVDRGPKTVEASARAHLHRTDQTTSGSDLDRHFAGLRRCVDLLARSADCVSIELTVSSYDEILERLSVRDRYDATYIRHLHAFLQEFQRTDAVAGVRSLVLDAASPFEQNRAAAALAFRAARESA